MFVIANEKMHELNKKGEKAGLRKDFSGVGLFHYELAKRLSSDEITGLIRFISVILKNTPVKSIVSSVFNVKFLTNQLSWFEQQILYRDQSGEDNKYQSVSLDSENKIFLKNKKLIFEYDGKCFAVNLKTLSKKESKSTFPKFISKEK
ncbi:MAG: hypothetical protein LBU74_04605 [Methanobacteriaceae archaeon]|jgi:hypothetical protein|nr:hypothetical protein [Candidatus Methanorudis spinitermitis]